MGSFVRAVSKASPPSFFHSISSPSANATRASHSWASPDMKKTVSKVDEEEERNEETGKEEPYWIPHPVSGIYHPKGQHKWIDNLPSQQMQDHNPNKSEEEQKGYWLRSLSLKDLQRPPPD